MHPRLVAVAACQGGVFTTNQAYATGYSPDEVQALLRSKVWHPLRRGIYATKETVAAATTHDLRHALAAAAALLAVQGDVAASMTTAARLHGLALLTPPSDTVHLTRSDLVGTRTYPGLRVDQGQLPAEHVTYPRGLRSTSCARTVVDNARHMSFREGVVLVDSALRHRRVTHAELEAVIRDCHTWRGISRAQRVVAFADHRTDAESESLARVVFAELGLPAPEPHVTIDDERGIIGIADFLWRRYRTIAEIDGKLKYTDEPGMPKTDRLWKEKLRQERLEDAGFQVVRITWHQLTHDLPRLKARLLRAFQRGLALTR